MVSQASGRTQRRLLAKTLEDIFELDRGTRFVAFYQDQYMLAGGMRKGTQSLDPDDEAHDIDLKLAKTGEIARSWQRWFGDLEAMVLKYERLNLLFVPLSEGRFLVLSTTPATDPVSLADALRRRIDLGSLVCKIP
jgi:hypothetical protein